ncbi:cytochrome b [Rheinheimera maricola]|uniref:Cytochrome b n=1 Tax=Rheinheimera maricola TaxID=2793282 RepID=A0ABS7X791_9GAMM|nr:cytochrome b [Rheinheimera maricola]MBZ9610980.1 cytochrome b [Rheinheimera maricola]
MYKNSQSHYGVVSVLLHWLVAISVFGLFAAGFWMVDLNYYSQWYRTVPHWHKSTGILLAIVMLVRLLWRWYSPPPAALDSHRRWEKKTSAIVQCCLYVGILLMVISGYLISTEDGRAIAVFGWFDVPALGALFTNQADIAGLVHEYVAYSLIALAVLHGMAALKHHYIDRDHTLKRMFGRKP